MKMNKIWKKHGINIQPGTVIEGKWHEKKYTIIRKLGAGAVGSVYLCERNGRHSALKISEQGTAMTVEVNVLKSLKKVQGNRLGPYLLDVDDWVTPQGVTISFYVMEYLRGENMATFIRHNGPDWIGVFLFQLLDDLVELHRLGWVFGDLKLDNLIVVSSPPRVRLIDVGGTTKEGRAIKEYTEFYDRGYWGLGSRRAEPSYDLFALVMIFLHVFYPQEFAKENDAQKTLIKHLDGVKALKPYRRPLQKALLGRYQSGIEMKQDITNSLYKQQNSQQRKKRKSPSLIETSLLVGMATIYYLASLLVL